MCTFQALEMKLKIIKQTNMVVKPIMDGTNINIKIWVNVWLS